MRSTRGPSMAGLLPLLVCLIIRPAITNANIVGIRTPATAAEKQITIPVPINNNADTRIIEFLNLQSPSNINNAILALVDQENIIPEKSNVELNSDQQVDQSEIIVVNTGDAKELENIEHALSTIEYEPQKIHKKGKRRIANAVNKNPDSIISSSDITDQASSNMPNVYYEVPRSSQAKKIAANPPYYSIPISENPENTAQLKSDDIDYAYLDPAPRSTKSRISRTRSSSNLQTIPSTDSSKLPSPPLYRSYPSQFAETQPRKQIYYTDSIVTTTPSLELREITKPSKRRKSRKRVAHKDANTSESSSADDNNNSGTELNRSGGFINSEDGNKSRTLGLLAKYDIAPRSFSTGRSLSGNQGSNLEKPGQEGASSEVIRGSNNRNRGPNIVPSSNVDTTNYSKVVDPAKGTIPILKRKLYERKDYQGNPTFPDEQKEYRKTEPSKPIRNRSNLSFRNSHISDDDSHTANKTLNDEFMSAQVSPVTSSTLDEYQNVKFPVGTSYPINPIISTAITQPQPNNYVYYPSLFTTLPPEQKFEDTSDTNNVWKVESNSSKSKKKRKGRTEGKIRGVSDGVAEATKNVETDNDEVLKGNGNYKVKERPVEDYDTEKGEDENVRHIQGDRAMESSGHRSDDFDGRTDNGRYAQTYDDTQTDGSYDNESHQNLEKGASNSDVMEKEHEGGGQEKYEMGEGAEKKEEHDQAEGEKEDKGYKNWHEEEKSNKGHHEKEQHKNYYDEEDGKEKEHKDEGGYHEEHQENEKGEKQAEFGEKGEHQKGYSTKGQHSIHKKDEFEKRTEFFDEYHDEEDAEKDGQFYQEHEQSKGGKYKKSHHDKGDHEEKYGKEKKYEKGGHYDDHKGHKIEEGDDSHYEHKDMYGKKGEHEVGKKWSYKEGDDGGGSKKNE